jgi:hypothetical protein
MSRRSFLRAIPFALRAIPLSTCIDGQHRLTMSAAIHDIAHQILFTDGGQMASAERKMARSNVRTKMHRGRTRQSRPAHSQKATSQSASSSGESGDDGGGDGDGDAASPLIIIFPIVIEPFKEPSNKSTSTNSLFKEEAIKLLFQILLKIVEGAITITTGFLIAKLLLEWGLK